MTEPWRWAGACSIGTSHIKAGIECQDRASCLVTPTESGPIFTVVVSDGAGSASEAGRGAAIVVSEFHRRARSYLSANGVVSDISSAMVADWIDAVRDRIGLAASARKLQPRDFAATLVALIAGADEAVIVHIGDGAVVVRDKATGVWSVPSWPYHGEYASTTRFVVDEPEAGCEVVHVAGRIDRFAVFSDGLENLILDHRNKAAPGDLFERLIHPIVAWEGVGRSRPLSRHLRTYLASDKVCSETDDDKSLILGARH